MEHCDVEIPTKAKRPKLSDGGGGGGSEDRLSALPDDILIHILCKNRDTAEAARTSVFSHRWRRLWTQLWFGSSTDPHGIRAALESHQAPVLRRLAVSSQDPSPESLAVWLPVAARRLSGKLILIDKEWENKPQDDEAAEGGAIELPCFENATSIRLALYLYLTLPPSGVFAGLTSLFLAYIEVHGSCMLGDVVSSPRCPALRRLTVFYSSGLDKIAIHSDSLLQINLQHLHDVQELTLMAPALKLLDVTSCFAELDGDNQPVANISAPLLVELFWKDAYDPRFTKFGNMENLDWLSIKGFVVYGKLGSKLKLHNSYWMDLLRSWRHIHNLRVVLFFPKDITNCEYLMEDSTRFPNIRNLALDIKAEGHSCGATLYHVLRMCTGVTELYLTLLGTRGSPEAQTLCPSGCVCDQAPNWNTDELALNCLREVRISKLRATEYEAGLLKLLLDWAKVLETVTVTFDCSVAESKAREFCQMLQSFCRPGVCLKGPHFV